MIISDDDSDSDSDNILLVDYSDSVNADDEEENRSDDIGNSMSPPDTMLFTSSKKNTKTSSAASSRWSDLRRGMLSTFSLPKRSAAGAATTRSNKFYKLITCRIRNPCWHILSIIYLQCEGAQWINLISCKWSGNCNFGEVTSQSVNELQLRNITLDS